MELYTIDEVAKMLKVHDRTVRRYIRAGELKGSNLGTKNKPNWRFTKKDIEEYLEKRRVSEEEDVDGK